MTTRNFKGIIPYFFPPKQIREIKGNEAYPPRLPVTRTRVAAGREPRHSWIGFRERDRGENHLRLRFWKNLKEIWQGILFLVFLFNFWYNKHIIEQKYGCDFPIVDCPLVLRKRGWCPMSTSEVLTLLLVVFAALSYIDNHNNKKK